MLATIIHQLFPFQENPDGSPAIACLGRMSVAVPDAVKRRRTA
jgi:hypothetical protein